jgi:hypothetical protein
LECIEECLPIEKDNPFEISSVEAVQEKTEKTNPFKILPEYLKPYVKSAHLLKDDQGIHVYDANFVYLGTLMGEEAVSAPSDTDDSLAKSSKLESDLMKQNSQTLKILADSKDTLSGTTSVGSGSAQFLDSHDMIMPSTVDPSLVFDLEINGKKYAWKYNNGFYFVFNKDGLNIFEYYSSDLFLGVEKTVNYLVFKNTKVGFFYGMFLDGRRVNIKSRNMEICPVRNINLEKEMTASEKQKPKSDEDTMAEISTAEIAVTPFEIINNLCDAIWQYVNKYKLSADLFCRKKLGETNRDVLYKVLSGHLGELNEETAEAAKEGVSAKFIGSFTLLKAALIHEFFINTTVAGRGGSDQSPMPWFIADIIKVKKDGQADLEAVMMDNENQKAMVENLLKFKKTYADKADTIDNIYRKMILDSYFIHLIKNKKAVLETEFKGFMISKIYEFTTRLDRGEGITFIRLVRDIIDAKPTG